MDPGSGVVAHLLDHATVYDIADTVDSHADLGDVCRDNTFSTPVILLAQDLLLCHWKSAEQPENFKRGGDRTQLAIDRLNVVLPRHEYQDMARTFLCVDSQCFVYCCMDVVGGRALKVSHCDWVRCLIPVQRWWKIEKYLKSGSIRVGRHDDGFEVATAKYSSLEKRQQEVEVD